MITPSKHTAPSSETLPILLHKEQLTTLPFKEFVRESDVETSFSMVMATLKAKIVSVPPDLGVMLTLRIKYDNNVAIAYIPNIYNGETISITAQAQWAVAHGGSIHAECVVSEACALEEASLEWMCIDVPRPALGEVRSLDDGTPIARSGNVGTSTTIVCAPVIVFEGSDYISLEPGSNPGWVKIKLVNGE